MRTTAVLWSVARPPGSRARRFCACQGRRPRRVAGALALTRPSILPSKVPNSSALLISDNFAAPWLAYTSPYRRFTHDLAIIRARLGADLDRYSLIAADFHRITPCRSPGAPKHVDPLPASARLLLECARCRGCGTAARFKRCQTRASFVAGPRASSWKDRLDGESPRSRRRVARAVAACRPSLSTHSVHCLRFRTFTLADPLAVIDGILISFYDSNVGDLLIRNVPPQRLRR